MKLSTILSFTALSATATLAFPLSPFRGLRARADLEERDVYAPAPVRRSDVAPSVQPTATESSSESTATGSSSESAATDSISSDTASVTTTSSTSEATSTSSDSSSSGSVDSTNTWLYSTITDNGSMTTPPASTRTLDPTTETASATTETDAPQSTDGSNNNQNFNNNNGGISQQVVIRIKEVIKIKEVIFVEQPVLVAVQVNIKVRQTIIVNEIRNAFISRFDNWDQNVVDELGLVISEQFDILTRSRNSGFDNLSNDQYNRYVSKFISQFQVFQSFQLVDVQQFVTVMKSFGVNQLATFFGRSDSVFSQDTFNRFNIHNDFTIFVQQLTVIVESVSVNSFDSDNLFGFGSGSLVDTVSIQI